MTSNQITREIIGAAMKVHSTLGPGLLESAYRGCLCHELSARGLRVQKEAVLPMCYDGVTIDVGYRLDLVVEDTVIVELKAQERVLPVHKSQLLSYLKMARRPLGLLINFHVLRLRDGITRIAN